MPSTGGGVLHVTNGDAAVPALRAHGIEGPILPWRDCSTRVRCPPSSRRDCVS